MLKDFAQILKYELIFRGANLRLVNMTMAAIEIANRNTERGTPSAFSPIPTEQRVALARLEEDGRLYSSFPIGVRPRTPDSYEVPLKDETVTGLTLAEARA